MLQENAEGSSMIMIIWTFSIIFKSLVEDAVRRIIMEEKQRRRGERPSKVRLGMVCFRLIILNLSNIPHQMRYVYVGVDLSATVLANDFEPNRFRAAQKCLLEFFEKFFELNPLSMVPLIRHRLIIIAYQMGIIIGREKRAERICSFTSIFWKILSATN